MIGDLSSFLEVSWNCPYLAPMRLCLGAGVASEVVALICACRSRVCEAIVPEFFTCTTGALLVERIGWMSHNLCITRRKTGLLLNLGERDGKPIQLGRWR